jgi:hypothetical protein
MIQRTPIQISSLKQHHITMENYNENSQQSCEQSPDISNFDKQHNGFIESSNAAKAVIQLITDKQHNDLTESTDQAKLAIQKMITTHDIQVLQLNKIIISQQNEIFRLNNRNIQRMIQLHLVEEGNFTYQDMAIEHEELLRKVTRLEETIDNFESINFSLQFENESIKKELFNEHRNKQCKNCNPARQHCNICGKQYYCTNEHCVFYYNDQFNNCKCNHTFCSYCNIRKRKRFLSEITQATQQTRQSSHDAEAAATQLAGHHAQIEQDVTNYIINQRADNQAQNQQNHHNQNM